MATSLEDRNFVVIGSGAAGLVGAVIAHARGLRPIIIEKADVWGGTTALSGGVMWIPANHLMARDGDADTPQGAQDYILNLMGEEAAPARVLAKVEAFLDAAPAMVRSLEELGVRWLRNAEHPDYYPQVAGARVGRTLECDLVDETALGPLLDTLRSPAIRVPPMPTSEFGACMRAKTGIAPFLTAAKVVLRDLLTRATGHERASRGRALLVSLMSIARDAGIPVLLGSRMAGLETDGGRVVKVTIDGPDGRFSIAPSAGVLLASGGFGRNRELRLKYHGVDGSWSSAPPEDEGDALLAGQAIGAGTEFTRHAWWQPSLVIAPGSVAITLAERAFPGSIIVDHEGRRYMNEAQSYMGGGTAMRQHGGATHAHWLVFDDRFARRYIFRALSRDDVRSTMMEHGNLRQADTIEDLASACGIEPGRLRDTVERFNGFARSGVDEDFGRGSTDYDRYWADPANRPNASLGEIRDGPFFAARIVPGDLGTNGGLMTDEHGRVLDEHDKPIAGLYAAGNCSGSPFGGYYPGGGATIGAAMTFGYLSALHAARTFNRKC